MKRGRAQGIVACVMVVALGWSTARAAEPKAADPQVAREYRVQVALDIDAQGHVAAVGLPSEIPSMLVAPTQDAFRHWRFRPPMREGHAVTARTYAGVSVQLVRRPDSNYGLRVVYGQNGPKLIYSHLPVYPVEGLRRHGQGALVMEVVVRPDGSLSDITVASARISGGDVGDFRKVVETV